MRSNTWERYVYHCIRGFDGDWRGELGQGYAFLLVYLFNFNHIQFQFHFYACALPYRP